MGLLDTQQKKPGLLNSSPITPEAMNFFAPNLLKGPSTAMADSTSPTPTGPDTADLLRTGAQGIVRSAADVGVAAGQDLAALVSPQAGARARAITPEPTGLMKVAIGSEPVDTSQLADTAVNYESVLKKLGIGGGFGTGIAVFGSILPDALTFTGFGGEAKVTKALVEAKSAAETAAVLEKLKVPPALIPKYSEYFANAGTANEVKSGLSALKHDQALGSAKAADSITPEIQAKAAADWEKAYAPKAQELSDQISKIETDLKAAKAAERPPLQEALGGLQKQAADLEQGFLNKYAVSDLRTGGDTLFHGADTETANLIRKGGFIGSKDFPGSGMVSLTSDPIEAAHYANLSGKEGEVLPVSVKGNNIKTYSSLKEYTDAIEKAPGATAGEKEANLNSAYDMVRIKDDGKPDIVFANPKSAEVANATPTHAPQEPGVPGEAVDHPSTQTLPEQNPSESPQATIPSVEPSLASVKQLPAEVSKPFEDVVGIGAKTTKEPNLFQRVTKSLDNGFTKLTEYVQDAEVRVRKLLENPEMKVTDETNPYQKMTLYPGRVASRIEEARAGMESVANDITSIAHDTGRDVAAVRTDVNEYLQAVHAPERNVVLGDGAAGMTNAEARAALERIKGTPGYAEIKQVADQVRELNNKGLGLLHDSGVISDDLFKTLTERYPNHVPLNRLFEDEPDIGGALSVRGFDVKSTGIKAAKGSEREVTDIVGNVQHNYEQSVIRSEKNIVDQATLGFVRANAEDLRGLMEVRKPKAIGMSFDDKILLERTTDPSYLQMFEKGKPVWIKINDPALALAFRGVNREKLPTLLNTVGAFTRFYAGLATRFNPEFAFPNKLRDLQETMIYMAAQKDIGFKGAGKMLLKDPASTKAVFDAIRGADTPGARLYEEMRQLGGTTGGFGLSTRKQVQLDFEDMLANAQSNPRMWAGNIVKYIDHWNTIFEDSTRLSVYRQAISQGVTKDRAAALAKEASINFNRMGRGGPVINAIWMFSNASIQGSAKMIRSLRNPKVLAAVTATVGASVGAVNEWNDHIDPEWRNKVTKWDRLNGLPIILPNDKGEGVSYVVIPVSWGVKPIKVMADYAYDAATGKDIKLATAASDFFTSVADAYNPLGGTDVVSAFTPTVLDVPVEIVRNQSWSGSKIHPDFDKNAPRDVQYFSSLGQTATGQTFIEGTKELQKKTGIAMSPADMAYAFDQYIGGAGKALEKTANLAIGTITGKPPPADEFPFISRFYRTRTQEEVGLGATGDNQTLKNVLQGQSRENFYKKQAAEDKYAELAKLSPADAAKQWAEINKENPELGKDIATIANDNKKGMTYTERLISQLGVKDGSRALYIKGKLDELKTDQDKGVLWQDYVKKGIITPQVSDQIDYLLKNPTATQKQSKANGGITDIIAAATGAKTAYAAERPDESYYIRDNKVSASDLDEARAVLFGEVSNRAGDKQQLEAQTILNTAFNRMDAYRGKGSDKSLTEVLQQPNQYQAYNGKEYERYKSGKLTPADQKKLEAIDAMLAKVKDGTFQNNIGSYVFYSHKPDGRIIATSRKLFM